MITLLSSPRFPAACLMAMTAIAALPASAAPDDRVSVRYSHSADNTLELGDTPGGEVGVHAAMLDWGSSLPINPSTRLNYGPPPA